MANSVMFFYENQLGGQLVFGRTSDHILSDISGMSQVSATVAETQGVGQVGATAAGASIQPKTITGNGTVRTAAGRAACGGIARRARRAGHGGRHKEVYY